jgi:hypothetical protein
MSQRIHEVRLDKTGRLAAQPRRGRNCWQTAISPVFRIEPGDEANCQQALDWQITTSGVADSAGRDLNAAHP